MPILLCDNYVNVFTVCFVSINLICTHFYAAEQVRLGVLCAIVVRTQNCVQSYKNFLIYASFMAEIDF